jgi:hypothetical protein
VKALLSLLLLATMFVGCLDGDPNPTDPTQNASSSGIGGSTSGSPSPSPTTQPSGTCSQQNAQAVNLPFRNNFADRSVKIFWVDYGCNEQAYNTIAPGGTHVQQTYVGHPWRVRDAVTNALYKEVVPSTTAPPEVTVP